MQDVTYAMLVLWQCCVVRIVCVCVGLQLRVVHISDKVLFVSILLCTCILQQWYIWVDMLRHKFPTVFGNMYALPSCAAVSPLLRGQ